MRKLFRHNKKSLFVCLLILNMLYAGVIMIGPYVNEQMINALVDQKFNVVTTYIMYLFCLFVLGQVLMYAIDIFSGKCEKEAYLNIVRKAHNVVLYFDAKKNTISDDLVSEQLGQNYQIVRPYIIEYPIELITEVILEIGIFIILCRKSLLIGLVVGVFVPLFIFISMKYSDRLGNNGKDVNKSVNDIRSYLKDSAKVSFAERNRNHSYFVPFHNLLSLYRNRKEKQVRQEAFFANVLSYALLNFLIFVQCK